MGNKTVQWTPAQSAAINLRNRTLLVSAAAGSGKTAVLTERIIKRLTDTTSPCDISRMLIVTFTKAAANELKARISKAISEAIAENPLNKHLSKQLLLLSNAKICTIHSFCLDTVKKNLPLLGLPDRIGVASETEMKLCSHDIMNEVIDDAYNGIFEKGCEISDFSDFIDMFSKNGDDSGTVDIFLEIYKVVMSYPEGINFLKLHASELYSDSEKPVYDSRHGRIIANNAGNSAKYLYLKYQSLHDEIRKNDEIAYGKYVGLMTDEISMLVSVLGNLESGRADLAKAIVNAFVPARLPSMPNGYRSVYTDTLKSLRTERNELTDILATLFARSEELIKNETVLTAKCVENLYRILACFDKRFKDEKKRISRLDFTDIERYAYSLLVNDGKPTETAIELSKDYDEIYIDEYQDTNSIQDRIFSAISTPYNRFMVGDIKQSIYGFRGAAPENFANYRDSFVMYDANRNEADLSPCTLFLSDNFRCDNSVVDFCNRIFSCLFRNNTGRIKYYDSDNLVCSKANGKDNNFPVNVVLAQKNSDDNGGCCEAEYIAHEVTRLLNTCKNKDGSAVSPSDIAILVRSWKYSAAITEELEKVGIPSVNNAQTEFFENPEILLMLSLLNTIDNPMRDIYLAGTLRSPIFGFTLDELVCIRAFDNSPSLYEALVAYTESTGFIKGRKFLAKLDYFRELTTGTQIDKLIWKLYRECNMFAIAANNHAPDCTPNEVRKNLMFLYKYARDFESSSFKGLSSFIKYVDDIIASDTKLAKNNKNLTSDNVVRIMTIHQSKGLEFPVVFLAAANKTGNNKSTNKPVLIDRHAGISVDLTDSMKVSKITTLHRTALEICINENSYEEEMRLLYVALTRARERLYVTGDFSNPQSELERAELLSKDICPYVIMNNLSYMRLILIALNNSGKGNFNILTPNDLVKSFSELPEKTMQAIIDISSDEFFKVVKSNIEFKYKYSDSQKVPSKLAVSDLSDNVLDLNVEKNSATLKDKLSLIQPKFARNDANESNGAKHGTATHVFMQFCDFELAEKNGIDSEILRLTKNKYILPEDADTIDRKNAAAFFKSRLYLDTIKPSRKIFREYRFNVQLPAEKFTGNSELKQKLSDEKLFIQGVIDCFTENSDGTYTLIDYKTDYIPHEIRKSDEAVLKFIAERHAKQLSYYKQALEIIIKRPVARVLIYSFSLGTDIDITEFC